MNDDLSKFRPLLDTITSYVTLCSGYDLVCYESSYLGVEFKYPGGVMPLAIDPTRPVPYLVKMLTKAIPIHQAIMALKIPSAWGEPTIPV